MTMAADRRQWPHQHAVEAASGRGHLRLVTCGAVGSGKSTLVGRLRNDFGLLPEDAALKAQRDQGAAVGGEGRLLATDRRTFIVAEVPGHKPHARELVTAAATADLALLVVDVQQGLLPQAKRHIAICATLGVRHLIVAVNKIDLVSYAQETYDAAVGACAELATRIGFLSVTPIPTSARLGDNITERSTRTAWYSGPTLLAALEAVDTGSDPAAKPFRLSVRTTDRPHGEFRRCSGTVASGDIRVGDEVVVLPRGSESRIAGIVTADGDRTDAAAGHAVTLTLADDIGVSRGDLIAARAAPAQISDQLSAHVVWMDDAPLLPGRTYLMRAGDQWTTASVTALRHKIDIHTAGSLPARELAINEIAVCHLATTEPIAFDPHAENRSTGAFTLIDRFSNDTVAVGTIDFGLRRATNLRWETLAVDKSARAERKQQRPRILWFTGLPGAGKSTIANLVEQKLHARGCHTYMLDGDNVRHGLNRDLGFTVADRVENVRRLGEVAKLMLDAGLIVLCAAISPFRAERQMVRELVEDGELVEIFVDAPLALCMERDPKGLYAKARAGLIRNLTGFDSPYDRPEAPDLHLDTASATAETLADRVVAHVLGHVLARQ